MKRNNIISSFITFILILSLVLIYGCSSKNPLPPDLSQKESDQIRSLAKRSNGDPEILAIMNNINEQLAAKGLNIAVEELEFFTIGYGRPINRIHQSGDRWVPNDQRRLAQDADITYIVDQTYGATASGLSNTQTEAAVDRALHTWNSEEALKKVNIVKGSDPGVDITIYDWFYGCGGYGYWYLADIVNAGWWPKAFFEAVGGPGGGDEILAFSVTFIFGSYDAQGNFIPSDVNGDNYFDTALNEVYYNDGFNWGIDANLPQFDVETVALHENGHSLCIGHFGPPPIAVMNPVYAGINHEPYPTDHAGMVAVWGSWPNP